MKNKKLKLAVLASASLPIPPYQGYGGTQRGIYDFLTYMNSQGHKVHLFGPGDSNVSNLENVVLHSSIDKSLWLPSNKLSLDEKDALSKKHYEKSLEDLANLKKSEEVDIVNLRSDRISLLNNLIDLFGKNRVVYGLHNVKSITKLEAIRDSGVTCVAHCRNHSEQYGNLPNIKTIVYGIDTQNYPFSREPLTSSDETPSLDILKKLKKEGRDYLITLGAIGSHKGQKTAINLARRTNIPLIIAGTPQNRKSTEKQAYFEKEIIPQLDNDILYFGNANETQKKELLKFAKGFLFPSGYEDKSWNEPFGRAPVEALSCGTPVIAYRKGSMPEIIFDSFNGFLFEDFEGAVKNIKSLEKIKRENCRDTAHVKFDSSRVAEEYEKLFFKLLGWTK